MKYVHYYETTSAFTEDYEGEAYLEPWVSYTHENDHVDYNKHGSPSGDYDYVDLGLPSGTLWATCNIGATSPEEYGNYYAWGETEPKETYTDANYKYSNGAATMVTSSLTKYNSSDGLTVLEPSDDAAYVNMGENWHMPTWAQFQELTANTTTASTQLNDVDGVLFTSKTDPTKTLFIPLAGWKIGSTVESVGSNVNLSSTLLNASSRVNIYGVIIGKTFISGHGYFNRGVGQTVRGVMDAS